MEYQEILNKIIMEVVDGITETTDKRSLDRYQRIVDYLNILVGRKNMK